MFSSVAFPVCFGMHEVLVLEIVFRAVIGEPKLVSFTIVKLCGAPDNGKDQSGTLDRYISANTSMPASWHILLVRPITCPPPELPIRTTPAACR